MLQPLERCVGLAPDLAQIAQRRRAPWDVAHRRLDGRIWGTSGVEASAKTSPKHPQIETRLMESGLPALAHRVQSSLSALDERPGMACRAERDDVAQQLRRQVNDAGLGDVLRLDEERLRLEVNVSGNLDAIKLSSAQPAEGNEPEDREVPRQSPQPLAALGAERGDALEDVVQFIGLEVDEQRTLYAQRLPHVAQDVMHGIALDGEPRVHEGESQDAQVAPAHGSGGQAVSEASTHEQREHVGVYVSERQVAIEVAENGTGGRFVGTSHGSRGEPGITGVVGDAIECVGQTACRASICSNRWETGDAELAMLHRISVPGSAHSRKWALPPRQLRCLPDRVSGQPRTLGGGARGVWWRRRYGQDTALRGVPQRKTASPLSASLQGSADPRSNRDSLFGGAS